MISKLGILIVAVAVGAASGVDDNLSDFSNNLFTDLGPLLALFGESMTKQYLSESTSFLDYFIFAMCPIGIITTVVSAVRLCGHSSLRAFVGRSQEGNGVVEAELCTSTSRDVCELFNRGGIARVLGRPTILELVQVEEQQPDRKAGLHLSRHFFTMGEATIPWTRVKDSHNLPLGSSASNPPNLSLNVGIVKQDDWKFLMVAILGLLLQAGVLALAGVGVWVLQWNLSGSGNSASRNYPPIMFIIGTLMLCGGLWACATLIGETTHEIRYKRKAGAKQSSRLIWLQPQQVIGDQGFDPFAYIDQKKRIMIWTASKKEIRNSRYKMYQVSTFFAVAAILTGYVMQFIGLRGMQAWVSLTQLGITIIMSMLRGLLRMKRLDSDGNDNELADMRDMVEGYELEWLAFKIAQSKASCTADDSSLESESSVTKKSVRSKLKSTLAPPRASRVRSYCKSGINTSTGHAAIESHKVLGHRQDSANDQHFMNSQKSLPLCNRSTSIECSKHHVIQADQKRLLSVRERLSHLTGNLPATISLEEGEFMVWKDKFVKVRSKARCLASALGSTANILFRQNVAENIDVPVLGFMNATRCATCDHGDAVVVNMKATHGQYGPSWAVDSAKIESLLGLTLWSLVSDPRTVNMRTTTDEDNESPFKTSWSDVIQTRRIISVGFETEGMDHRAHSQMEVDFWLGSNQLEISHADIFPDGPPRFNLGDLWRVA